MLATDHAPDRPTLTARTLDLYGVLPMSQTLLQAHPTQVSAAAG